MFVAPYIQQGLLFTAASFELGHPKAGPDKPGKRAPRLALASFWNLDVEYPRDNGHDDEKGWRKTWYCPECAHVARYPWVASRHAHRCPKGCAWMVCLGAKLRVPRKAKLRKWLRKIRAAQTKGGRK